MFKGRRKRWWNEEVAEARKIWAKDKKRLSGKVRSRIVRKDQDNKKVLVDSGSEVNAMHTAYAAKLSLTVRKTDVEAKKINGSYPKTSPLLPQKTFVILRNMAQILNEDVKKSHENQIRLKDTESN